MNLRTVIGWMLALAATSPVAAAASAPAAANPAAPVPGAADLPPLRLADLLDEAARNNPRIAAERERVAASESVPSQSETPPDPVAGISYTNDGVTSITYGDRIMSNLTFSWTQEVPYPGKLHLAGEVARREIDVSRSRLASIELDVRSRIKGTFADLYRIDRTISILHEGGALLDAFLATARSRYETGTGLLENILKAQTEVTKLDADLEVMAEERAAASARLNALAGRREDTVLGVAADLPGEAGPIVAEELERLALERSPEIQELEARVRRDEARVDLAKRQTKPDLIWGAAYAARGDIDPMVMGSFGMRLPVHRERNQVQRIVQTGHDVEASRRDLESGRLEILSEVRSLAARAARAGSLARLYAEGIVPQSRNALDSASASYGVGKVDFLTLLDDFTALLNYSKEYETQRAERVAALAALERLTAADLLTVGEAGKSRNGVDDE